MLQRLKSIPKPMSTFPDPSPEMLIVDVRKEMIHARRIRNLFLLITDGRSGLPRLPPEIKCIIWEQIRGHYPRHYIREGGCNLL